MANTFMKLQKLMRTSQRILRKNLEPYDLHRGQPKVLHVLGHHGEMSKKELAERFDVAMPTVTKMIERLENKGFVTSKKDPKDKRRSVVILTDKGRETEEKLHRFKHQFGDFVFKGLTEDEVETLEILIDKMQHNVNEYKEEHETTT